MEREISLVASLDTWIKSHLKMGRPTLGHFISSANKLASVTLIEKVLTHKHLKNISHSSSLRNKPEYFLVL